MTENKNIIVALIGNPNVGKSTIFNNLTGSNQHVSNYPGTTVEKKEGSKKYKEYKINFIDLPGIYSLFAYSDDEAITRDFLLKKKPDLLINVIDVGNLERNLYLFTQITDITIPIIIVLNMFDILKFQNKTIDKKEVSDLLGVPVFVTIANKKIETNDIFDCIVNFVETWKLKNIITRAKVDYGNVIKNEANKLENLISENLKLLNFPKYWFAIRLLENDPVVLKLVSTIKNEVDVSIQLKKSRAHITEHFCKKTETEIVNMRYAFANSIARTILHETGRKRVDMTEIIDTFVLNKYLGIPIFALVMYIIFKFTFVFSYPMVNVFGFFFKWFSMIVARILPCGHMQSLVINGIIGGLGAVLSFLPLILLMFFAIAFFEDSGYMARAAFVMDKIMNKFGLQGKSFLPLMLSTNGCAVPGILSARTLDSKCDRLITMFVVPFMICGAKLPVFALIIGAFFPVKYQSGIMFFMYLLSIIVALSVAKFLSITILKDESACFVMELPPYHLPTIRSLLLKMWERGWIYIRKIATLIVILSIIIWAAFAYPKSPINDNLTKDEQIAFQVKYSFAGVLGKILEPLFKPIGMDGVRGIALIAGFAAKEIIVSTLSTIYALGNDFENVQSLKEKIANDKDWSVLKGITFLIFCLIYVPCIVSVSVFFKETNSSYKWLVFLVIGNTVFAWVASFIVFQLGMLLKIGI
jgi:ferrous iron transport protein B